MSARTATRTASKSISAFGERHQLCLRAVKRFDPSGTGNRIATSRGSNLDIELPAGSAGCSAPRFHNALFFVSVRV
jgi:hypothetical protein